MLLTYILLINIMTFLLFGEDKRRAGQQKWRIPEKTLLLFTLFGGSVGALLGMYVFHHKTRKGKFRVGVPGILILQFLILYKVFYL